MSRPLKNLCGVAFILACGSYIVGQIGPGEPGVANAASPLTIATEVAVSSGVISHGESVPLPVFADGVTATSEQCHWIFSPSQYPPEGSDNGPIYQFNCYKTGDSVNAVMLTGTGQATGLVNYLVIATRAVANPVSGSTLSWGQLKENYTSP